MLPEYYKDIPQDELHERIEVARKKLGDDVFILGHHYQRDSVIEHVDATGDSLKLSLIAGETSAKYIVFCGVHFMAETADIVNQGKKIVTLPDETAGCPMADMAQEKMVRKSWTRLTELMPETKICPITYINSYATLKAFCGENEGTVCTSTNAKEILTWALDKFDKVLFFPDQHLGRNTAKQLRLTGDDIVLLTRKTTDEQLKRAKVILWNGCCPVHDRFKVSDFEEAKKEYPDMKLLVHPEVPEAVADAADYMGSTNYIIKMIEDAEPGSQWMVATEVHLVGRLAKNHPDKIIKLLGKPICMCSMMDRTSPEHLLWNLEGLVKGEVINQVSVETEVAKKADIAIQRMFELTIDKD
jgi:quinolinate synthase